ncbi:MAG: AI-2E family transporter [Ruminococcus sp.]|nr:AI-2E family transporter [Ruminococcus sp.]
MNNYNNKKYSTLAKYILVIIAIAILMIVFVWKFSSFWNMAEKIIGVLMPVIWGGVLAFLMNPVMKQIERFLYRFIFKQKNHKKAVRAISLSLTCVFSITIVGGLLYVVIPEILNSITTIFDNISLWVEQLTEWVQKLFKNNEEIQKRLIAAINTYSSDVSTLLDTLKPILENISTSAFGVVNLIKNILLGFIVSVYILANKETHIGQIRKVILAIFKKKTCNKIFTVASQSNKIFTSFLIGKIIDSAIIGMITFICMTILGLPYVIIISVIVGVTNIIPFFGPFFGAIPSALLILLSTSSLKDVVIFSIMILAIQQFDGNILGPSILGNSTGLPAIWVLISLFIGGGLFGFVGMVLAVPTCALLYSFSRTAIANKLKAKKLPSDTSEYIGDIEHFYTNKTNKKPLTLNELEKIDIIPHEESNEIRFFSEADKTEDK